MTEPVYRFTHALARTPASSVAEGLRANDTGAPDPERFRHQHDDYIAVLRAAGVTVEVLEPLPAFPDSVFVEDVALCLAEGAVLLRPGAPSRAGEVAAIAPALAHHYAGVAAVDDRGTIDGGDVLVTPDGILVGLSARTDAAGIASLRAIVADWGYNVRAVHTPPGVLHFKSDCSLLDEDTVLATARLEGGGCFEGYRVIGTTPGEDAAANAIRVNDVVVMAAGFPGTRDTLVAAGYDVREVAASEASRLDGGMSCLSLRFTPPE